jgi:hypothetical protein
MKEAAAIACVASPSGDKIQGRWEKHKGEGKEWLFYQ